MLSFLVVATLWISHGFAELVVPDPTFKDLTPVPRHVWADSLADRADATASVALADYEKFIWASSESTSSQCHTAATQRRETLTGKQYRAKNL
jgi:hypothetical protein